MANLKDLLVNGSTNHVGRNYSQTPALGTKDRQVATTEFVLDNCYKPPLLSFMWADHLLNDMSWLRADTFSWQDGTTYSSAYNELLAEYNNSASVEETEGLITFKRTPKGYKIALADQENAILNKYNSNGIAWYYILDTTNTRFKLPRTKFGFEGLRTSVADDIEAYASLTVPCTSWGTTGTSFGTAESGRLVVGSGQSEIKETLESLRVAASDKTITSSNVQPPATQTYLYFYVGEFARNSVQQTAGLNSELFNNKLDLNANNLNTAGKSLISGLGMPSNKYIDLTLGASGSEYTVPANGYFVLDCPGSSSPFSIWVSCDKNGLLWFDGRANTDGSIQWTSPPCIENSTVRLYWGSLDTSKVAMFRFVYAEGSK